MEIFNLRDKTEHLNTLAQWHQREWGYLNPDSNLDTRLNKMQFFLVDEFIPHMYIAVENEQLLGSAACVAHDMDNRPELTPWLASVYVHPEFRGKGFGSSLVQHVMQQARQNNINELYLFTPDQEQFYLRLGWQLFEKTLYHGYPVTIMRVSFS